MNDDERDEVRRLYDQAMHALEDHRYEDAIEIGTLLKQRNFSGAFEVIALARGGQDDREGAVAELREGVSLAPSVWLLWQLLGNYLSDLERTAEALEAYERALGCPRVHEDAVQLNRAIALHRASRFEEALAAVERIRAGECLQRATVLRLGLLNRLARYEEVLADPPYALEDPAEHAHALGERAVAMLDGRGDAAGARETAEAAVGEGRFDGAAAEVLRRARGMTSPNAQDYRLRIAGRWPGAKGEDGFFRVFQVVADTPEGALAFASTFEPAAVRASLRVENVEAEEAAPGKLLGVYWASGHVFFPLDSGS
jgi:tetratricopeptide (TPR) repeat protein